MVKSMSLRSWRERNVGQVLRLLAALVVLVVPKVFAQDPTSDHVLIERLLDKDSAGFLAKVPAGMPINKELDTGLSALTIAAITDDADFIQRLIAGGYTPALDPTAVTEAAKMGAVNALKLFFATDPSLDGKVNEIAGAAIDFQNRAGLAYLHSAVVLEGQGKQLPESDACGLGIQERLRVQITSIEDEHLRVLAFLHERGAKLDRINTTAGGSTLTYSALAASRGEAILLLRLLQLRGETAQLDPTAVMQQAVKYGNEAAVAFLLATYPASFGPIVRAALIEQNQASLSAPVFMGLTKEPVPGLSEPTLDALLLGFVKTGESNAIIRVIALGAKVGSRSHELIVTAWKNAKPEALRVLLANGTNLDAISASGSSVLHGFAAAIGSPPSCTVDRWRKDVTESFDVLISAGARVDIINTAGFTALDEFVLAGDLRTHFSLPLSTDQATAKRAAFLSLERGKVDFLKWLVEERSVPAASKDAQGFSLVERAGSHREEILPYLVSMISDPVSQVAPERLIEVVYGMSLTSSLDFLGELIQAVPDVNQLTSDGNLLLVDALKKGSWGKADLIVASGGSLSATTASGERAIDFLCVREPYILKAPDLREYQRTLVKRMKQWGSALAAFAPRNLLLECIQKRGLDEDFLDTLVELGAPDIADTLRSRIATASRPELEWYRSKNADFSLTDSDGQPLIFLAIKARAIEAVAFIVELFPASATGRWKNEAPIEAAFQATSPAIARLLRAAGAVVDIKNSTSEGYAGFRNAESDEELAEIALLDILSTQLLATVSASLSEVDLTLQAFKDADSQKMQIEPWSINSVAPWKAMGTFPVKHGLSEYTWPWLSELPAPPSYYKNFGFFMWPAVSQSGHFYQGIVGNSQPDVGYQFCMRPSDCYQGQCGYCSIYQFVVSSNLTVPACPVAAVGLHACMSTVKIEHPTQSSATMNVVVDGKTEQVKPGSSLKVNRQSSEVAVTIGPVQGPTFYIQFSVSMDSLPVAPASFGVGPTARLNNFAKARWLQDQISQQVESLSTESAIVAHRYWSYLLAKAQYKDLAKNEFRKGLQLADTYPPVFDELTLAFEKLDDVAFDQLPVISEKVKVLAASSAITVDGKGSLVALANELASATGMGLAARARLIALRTALVHQHQVMGDALRLALLEYQQFAGPEDVGFLKIMPAASKNLLTRRLKRLQYESVSPERQALDVKLLQLIQ